MSVGNESGKKMTTTKTKKKKKMMVKSLEGGAERGRDRFRTRGVYLSKRFQMGVALGPFLNI